MTDPIQDDEEAVATALAKAWAKRFLGDESRYSVYLDDFLRDDARTAIAALPPRLSAAKEARIEALEAENERLREALKSTASRAHAVLSRVPTETPNG